MKAATDEGIEILDRFEEEVPTIPQMFNNTVQHYGSKPANTFKSCREWKTISYSEWAGISEEIAIALIRRGVRKGDDIAIMSQVCAQRGWISMGVLMCGAVANTITPLVDDKELKFIINRSDIKYLFVENMAMLERVLPLRSQMPTLKGIICFDEKYRGGRNNLWGLQDFRMLGINRSLRPVDLKSYWQRLVPEDPAILDYSMSTTGLLKCRPIKHGDWIKAERSQYRGILTETLQGKYNNVLTCFLPASTSQEWVSGFYSLVAIGAQIKYGPGPSRLSRLQDLKTIRQAAAV
ncbi:MAG: AMP-binding protein [Syntrophomonadaceae bacterium]|nr:AMP-binding protein [Syntrophomonadaceae bacterium]